MDWYTWADEPIDQKILDEFSDVGNELKKELSPDEEWEAAWDELWADPDFPEFVQFMYSIRFYVNLLFIALPWWCFSATLEIGLIVGNAVFNKGFAEGNVYLMFNTILGAS